MSELPLPPPRPSFDFLKPLAFVFEDKRWMDAIYLLSALAPMLLLTTAARVLTVARRMPPTWRAWFTGLFPGTRP